MWTAFVFFGSPSKIYFIEDDTVSKCVESLKNSFGLDGKIEYGVSDVHYDYELTSLLSVFNITEEIFTSPQCDPLYFIQNKEETPVQKTKTDGQFCKLCRNFAGMAEPNQPDGSFLCWSCRDSNGWRFK